MMGGGEDGRPSYILEGGLVHENGGKTMYLDDGSLWLEVVSGSTEENQLLVEALDYANKFIVLDKQRLTPIEYPAIVPYLLAIENKNERITVVKDESWMAEALSLEVGSSVKVSPLTSMSITGAKVVHLGPLRGKVGHWIGVQLSKEADLREVDITAIPCMGQGSSFMTIAQVRLDTENSSYNKNINLPKTVEDQPKDWPDNAYGMSSHFPSLIGDSGAYHSTDMYSGTVVTGNTNSITTTTNMESAYFILREDFSDRRNAYKKGSLWKWQTAQDENRALYSSLDEVSLYAFIQNEKLSRISTPEITPYLMAESDWERRLLVLEDKEWVNEALQMAPGGIIRIFKCNSLLVDEAFGRLHYKGELKGRKGIWFGIQLSGDLEGQGLEDGIHEGERIFPCVKRRGVFLSLGNIRKESDSSKYFDMKESTAGIKQNHNPSSPYYVSTLDRDSCQAGLAEPYYIQLAEMSQANMWLAGSLWRGTKYVIGDSDYVVVTNVETNQEATIPKHLLRKVQKDIAQCLVAVVVKSNRLNIVENTVWLSELPRFKYGTIVQIVNKSKLPQGALGKIMFVGAIGGSVGTLFGIALSEELEGKGSTDGTFQHQKLFSCAENSGLVLSVDKLRLATVEESKRFRLVNSDDKCNVTESTTPPFSKFRRGDQVVWNTLGRGDGGIRGTVRYVGPKMDSSSNQMFVGVELNVKCGQSAGYFGGKKYFSCAQGHAILVPEKEIIKVESTMPQNSASVVQPGESPIQAHCTEKSYEAQHFSNHKSDLKVGERIVKIPCTNEVARGVIRWIGELPGRQSKATFVGVEFDGLQVGGCGGYYNGIQLFETRLGYGRFFPITRVKRESEFTVEDKDAMKRDIGLEETAFEDELPLHPVEHVATLAESYLKIGERIVDMKDDSVEYGTLKWIGYLEDGSPSTLYAGVEFDNRCGSGSGKHGKKQLFTAKPGHASFIPLEALMKECDFLPEREEYKKELEDVDMYSETKTDPSTVEQNTDYITLSSDDITSNGFPPVDSYVEIQKFKDSKNRFGMLRWIGRSENGLKWIAGVEMDQEQKGGSDGKLLNKRYFRCQLGRAVFVRADEVRPVVRFNEQISMRFGHRETPDVPGLVRLRSIKGDLEKVCGRYKGIQGHHNSCYMDATLFAMFFSTEAFDHLLEKPPADELNFSAYEKLQTVLREGIVNPLRDKYYVRADKVIHLRELLEHYGSVKGLTHEEKDPEEFLTSLLKDTLHADPFIKLNSGQDAHLYQLFAEKDVQLRIPSVQQILEQSFLQSDVKLRETPSIFVLQMPRFGKDYKLYSHILPSLELDITDILDCSFRLCVVCGEQAHFECRECYRGFGDSISHITFCQGCIKLSHSKLRSNHKFTKLKEVNVVEMPTSLHAGSEDQRIKMQLKAVVCIETSHYVSFVRCSSGPNSPWIFFDSMSDRKGGEVGYNIPMVKECQTLSQYLEPTDENKRYLVDTPPKELPEPVRRIICDAYMCFYQNPDINLYE